ncbi:MAG: hypothetical protein JKY37_00535 [Nannocystaceae bacterium]|nr:hypothetical protein [Nannocystaceae bacterium]
MLAPVIHRCGHRGVDCRHSQGDVVDQAEAREASQPPQRFVLTGYAQYAPHRPRDEICGGRVPGVVTGAQPAADSDGQCGKT